MADLPLPDVANAVAAPFWRAAREHRLVVQRCPACEGLQWPPRPLCSSCLAPLADSDWTEVRPTGTVWSFVVYHRAFHPGFADKLPYNVAMVRLDDGPVMITNVAGGNDLEIGERVTARFDEVAPQVSLVRFGRADRDAP